MKEINKIKDALFSTGKSWADNWLLPRMIASWVICIILLTALTVTLPFIVVLGIIELGIQLVLILTKNTVKDKLLRELNEFEKRLESNPRLKFESISTRFNMCMDISSFLQHQFFLF